MVCYICIVYELDLISMHYIGEGVGDAVGVQISGQLEVIPSSALL